MEGESIGQSAFLERDEPGLERRVSYGNISFLYPAYMKRAISCAMHSRRRYTHCIGVTRTYVNVTTYNRFFTKTPESLVLWRFLYNILTGVAIFVLSFVFRIAMAYFRIKRQAETDAGTKKRGGTEPAQVAGTTAFPVQYLNISTTKPTGNLQKRRC